MGEILNSILLKIEESNGDTFGLDKLSVMGMHNSVGVIHGQQFKLFISPIRPWGRDHWLPEDEIIIKNNAFTYRSIGKQPHINRAKDNSWRVDLPSATSCY